MYDIKMLKAKKLAELIEIAEQIGIKELKGLKKQDIIDKIVDNASEEKSSGIKHEPKVVKNNYRENRYNNGGNKNHQNKNFNKEIGRASCRERV